MSEVRRPKPAVALRRWIRRHVLVHRRLLAALCAGVAVLAGYAAAAPPPRTVPAWVLTRDVPAGTVLGRDDINQRRFLPDTVPSTAIKSPREAVGRPVTAAADRGSVVTPAMLLRPGLRTTPGTIPVPVRITDPDVAGLLKPGDQVRLLSTSLSGVEETSAAAKPFALPAQVIAEKATVLTVLPANSRVDSDVPGRLIVAAVEVTDAQTVVGQSAREFVTVTWIR